MSLFFFVRPAALKTPAVGCSVPVAADTHTHIHTCQQAFICLHSPCRATPFISVNLEHQIGTLSYCVQAVPSLVLTGMTNGRGDKGSAGSQGPWLPAERPLIRGKCAWLNLNVLSSILCFLHCDLFLSAHLVSNSFWCYNCPTSFDSYFRCHSCGSVLSHLRILSGEAVFW